jgi:hypothetical protein
VVFKEGADRGMGLRAVALTVAITLLSLAAVAVANCCYRRCLLLQLPLATIAVFKKHALLVRTS